MERIKKKNALITIPSLPSWVTSHPPGRSPCSDWLFKRYDPNLLRVTPLMPSPISPLPTTTLAFLTASQSSKHDVEPLDRTLAHRLPELAVSPIHTSFFASFSVPEVLCDLTIVLAKAFGISLDRSCLWPVPRRQSWRVGFRAWTPEHGYLWVKQWPWPFLQRPRAQCVWLLVFFHVA